MTRHLLPAGGQFYKANLHAHTNISDGSWSPEEMKAGFLSKGYQIVAFTDHEIMIDHSDLNEPEKFLAITSYEMAITEETPERSWEYARTYHLNFYAKDPHKKEHICFHPKYLWGNAEAFGKDAVYQGALYERRYDLAEVNKVIRTANENGFLVCYNHPVWSLQNYTDYAGLEGLWGTEIINGGTCVEGYEEYQPHVFEELLRLGKPVYPLATDDCHGPETAYIGFCMIKAPELTYPSVMQALEQGDFYASDGPLIHSLSLTDGTVHLTCSPAAQIRLQTERRRVHVCNATEKDLLTEAAFDLKDWVRYADLRHPESCFFRLSVKGADGRCAYTRAFFYPEVAADFAGLI